MATATGTEYQMTAQPEDRLKELTAEVARLRAELEQAKRTPHRRRLPDTRQSVTHKFSVGGHEGYITVGLYPDGAPGEVFAKIAKQGSTMSGLVDTAAILISIALQYGVPVNALARKFEHTRFEPSGHTKSPDIPVASSIADHIFRWLGITFSQAYREEHATRKGDDDNQCECSLPPSTA
jgi:ribonucleoside-diphosphate reductase alpha chain